MGKNPLIQEENPVFRLFDNLAQEIADKILQEEYGYYFKEDVPGGIEHDSVSKMEGRT